MKQRYRTEFEIDVTNARYCDMLLLKDPSGRTEREILSHYAFGNSEWYWLDVNERERENDGVVMFCQIALKNAACVRTIDATRSYMRH